MKNSESILTTHLRLAVVILSSLCFLAYTMYTNYKTFIIALLMCSNGYVLARIEDVYKRHEKRKKKVLKEIKKNG